MKRKRGFSLVEAAVALGIAGAFGLPVIQVVTTATRTVGLSQTTVLVQGLAADLLEAMGEDAGGKAVVPGAPAELSALIASLEISTECSIDHDVKTAWSQAPGLDRYTVAVRWVERRGDARTFTTSRLVERE